MAVKNTLLGGTDWLYNENIIAADLNDTIEALAGELDSWQ